MNERYTVRRRNEFQEKIGRTDSLDHAKTIADRRAPCTVWDGETLVYVTSIPKGAVS